MFSEERGMTFSYLLSLYLKFLSTHEGCLQVRGAVGKSSAGGEEGGMAEVNGRMPGG